MLAIAITILAACTKALLEPENNIVFKTNLSEYNIFKNNLTPQNGFTGYKLATTLFTDYSQKQRLIKLPPGTKLVQNGDGIPGFPEGTILVKTFYYFNDERDTSKGKKIIETRLLILEAGKWNVATYIWNESQTDAVLAKSASRQRVEWTDAQGNNKSVNYKIPAQNECATCHNASNRVVPIGPKLCNLNILVEKNGTEVNQLQAMMKDGLLESFDDASITKMADWQDDSAPLDKRVRAYLDVNCAHCHNPAGFASGQKLNLHYNIPIRETGITRKKQTIINKIRNGQMPKLGTTVVDEKALALIRKYFETL
jgi:uncharacterized repeat protein (TIGR03806 family)